MRYVLLLACLLVEPGELYASDTRYFVYGNQCQPSQTGQPPVCQLIGWPTDSPQAAFHALPWESEPDKKADKLPIPSAIVAHATAR